jgi:hypothetical protein
MNEALVTKIDEHRKSISELKMQIEDLTSERVKLEIALAAYEDALQLVQTKTPKKSSRAAEGEAPGRAPRKMKPEWAQVLGHFGKLHPRPFSTDEILDIARQVGLDLSRGAVRSQMALYADKRLIDRVENGSFRLTHLGFAEVGSSPPEEPWTNVSQPVAAGDPKPETADDYV